MNFLKANLTEFIPALAKLADERDFPWDRIDKLFLRKLNKRTALSNGETIVVQACIYDLIVSLKKGEMQALGLLHFLGRVFEELDAVLTPNEKRLVNGNVKNLLLSFDSNYLNYLGELAVLNNLLKSAIYRLVAVKYPLSNGKSIDFTLEHKETTRRVLVEVMNIQLDSDRVQADADMIRNFLTARLADKVAAKTDGLAEDISFYLIPVS